VAKRAVLAALLCASALAGCSLAPRYQTPQLAIAPPAVFKETGPWTPASPADLAPRGDWWTVFNDPTLNRLEDELVVSNQTLASAVARYDSARAIAAQARGPLLPEVGANPTAFRTQQSDNRPQGNGVGAEYDTVNGGGALSYELDLWGRVRNLAAVSGLQAQASEADLAGVKLSLQVELASTYMALRGADAQLALLTQTIDAYERAFKLTSTRHDGGASSGLDVGRSETLLQVARSQLQDASAQRAIFEHALATLTGASASTFSIPAAPAALTPPPTPVAAPSLLLQRRPDVAAAERRAHAANTQIGVARAALFPAVSLTGTGGYQTPGGMPLFEQPNIFWTLGAGFTAPIFDNGRRRAGVALAHAQFEQTSADYRAVVLTAFQNVEDQLALNNRLAASAESIDAAASAARRTEGLALARYRLGAANYLEVVTAQTAALQSEQQSLTVRTRRLQAAVALIRALGGGWDQTASAD
jgi:multidrug efflux system outer membrane protein